jgi:hypothetical protein
VRLDLGFRDSVEVVVRTGDEAGVWMVLQQIDCLRLVRNCRELLGNDCWEQIAIIDSFERFYCTFKVRESDHKMHPERRDKFQKVVIEHENGRPLRLFHNPKYSPKKCVD